MGPAVDNPDDVPKADAQVGGGSRRSRNLHGSTVARIVAPVEDILCWDRDISQSQFIVTRVSDDGSADTVFQVWSAHSESQNVLLVAFLCHSRRHSAG